MRDCCQEYADLLALVDKLKESASAMDKQALERIQRFIQEKWDAHQDRAVEGSFR